MIKRLIIRLSISHMSPHIDLIYTCVHIQQHEFRHSSLAIQGRIRYLNVSIFPVKQVLMESLRMYIYIYTV